MKKKAEKKKEANIAPIEKRYPSLVLGLDISTACIGISVVFDDGVNKPEILKITHVVPKIDKGISGIEALIRRKEIFENNFLKQLKEEMKITECVIEAPLVFATGNSNAQTVSQLLQFNALISESIYKELGIIPYYFSSYDARMYAFPELLAIRKFNKKGEPYPIKHIRNHIKSNTLTLFGSYPFDCEKKNIMMNLVNEAYQGINWILNKKGELKKENYDACDSLVCVLAYINRKKYGDINERIVDVSENEDEFEVNVDYSIKVWDDVTPFKRNILVKK